MEWKDIGIVLARRHHGESAAIVSLLTRDHGRHLGLVRGGSGTRMRPLLQPGNSLRAVWRARLDEHLGYFTVEGLQLRTGALLMSSHAIYAVTHVASLARLFPERDPHERVFEGLEAILDHLDDPSLAASLVVRFELQVLSELGFGLDLERCAATGADTELIYVSPKSGRAVSAAAGEAWSDRLMPLPAFLSGDVETRPPLAELAQGFALTSFFLGRHVFEPRGIAISDARQNFIAAVTRAMPSAA